MLYIMRHGRTEWNVLHRIQGRTDVPLNDEGRAMAARAAKEYADVPADVCFCSPLSRARETADIFLRGRDVPVIEDERLAEMCFGRYEGMADVLKVPGCPLRLLFKDPAEFFEHPVDGVESLKHLFARTGAFLIEKAAPLLDKEKNVFIVGHGAMNSSILCQVLKLPVSKFWDAGVEQCQLTKLPPPYPWEYISENLKRFSGREETAEYIK